MIRGYCDAFGIGIGDADLRAEAIEWSQTRGARSRAGGVAVCHGPRRAAQRASG
jgi:predicted AAA+ superfamily ATPase